MRNISKNMKMKTMRSIIQTLDKLTLMMKTNKNMEKNTEKFSKYKDQVSLVLIFILRMMMKLSFITFFFEFIISSLVCSSRSSLIIITVVIFVIDKMKWKLINLSFLFITIYSCPTMSYQHQRYENVLWRMKRRLFNSLMD